MSSFVPALEENVAILWVSPPASGKTSEVLSILRKANHLVVFFVPLRAIACELSKRLSKEFEVHEGRERPGSSAHVWVLTAEEVDESVLRCLERSFHLVVDEYHLISMWGDSFRPILKESYFILSEYSLGVVALTATLSTQAREEFRVENSGSRQAVWMLDCGNFELMYPPTKSIRFKSGNLHRLLDRLWHSLDFELDKTILIFCHSRRDVIELSHKIRSGGRRVLSCIGGEARQFVEKLEKYDGQHQGLVVVATCVLGHGVNLPRIDEIFILYFPDGPAYWLQMVARGGRDGSPYDLYYLDAR